MYTSNCNQYFSYIIFLKIQNNSIIKNRIISYVLFNYCYIFLTHEILHNNNIFRIHNYIKFFLVIIDFNILSNNFIRHYISFLI